MLSDFVKESISVGGTGNITLGGAVSGFVSFNTAFSTTGYFPYAIEDGNNREFGIGHLSASTTLVRDVVMETLVAGSYTGFAATPTAINATTSGFVFVSASAMKMAEMAGKVNVAFTTAGICGANYVPGSDANGSWSAVGSRVQYWYYRIDAPIIVASISINVTTLAATTNAYFGLYEIRHDGYPGNKILDSGALNVTTTGQKTGTISSTLVRPGWYIAAATTDSSNVPQVTCGIHSGLLAQSGSGFPNCTAKWRADVVQTTLPATGQTSSLVVDTNPSANAVPKMWLQSA